jgi:hypothetical protein
MAYGAWRAGIGLRQAHPLTVQRRRGRVRVGVARIGSGATGGDCQASRNMPWRCRAGDVAAATGV